jgi:hypothetical protein
MSSPESLGGRGWGPAAGEYGSDGEPQDAAASLPMKDLIRGWSNGLQMMRYGGASRLIVPPALGYGSVQSGPVPPNSTLCFDIRLLGRTEVVRFVPAVPAIAACLNRTLPASLSSPYPTLHRTAPHRTAPHCTRNAYGTRPWLGVDASPLSLAGSAWPLQLTPSVMT